MIDPSLGENPPDEPDEDFDEEAAADAEQETRISNHEDRMNREATDEEYGRIADIYERRIYGDDLP